MFNRELANVASVAISDRVTLLVREPAESSTHLPETKSVLQFLGLLKHAKTMLSTVVPPAFVFATVRPRVVAISFPLIITEHASILAACLE